MTKRQDSKRPGEVAGHAMEALVGDDPFVVPL